MPAPDRPVIGWDIGGAHVKAARLERGRVLDAAQWACPLWQGLDRLQAALAAARERWPNLDAADHAVTMTGEMVDLFTDRRDGVQRIAGLLAQALPAGALHFHAGERGFSDASGAGERWAEIASANWQATAQHCALRFGSGLLVDIGSTTTDLIAFRGGRLATLARSDFDRLASGELVYHGVVRTPLCAFGPRVGFRGRPVNVMNEWFATSADVYRLTGELDPAHDPHPSADGGPKDTDATCRRLARMIGLDARDEPPARWLELAHTWRGAQVARIAADLRRVLAAHPLPPDAPVISAGCGDFLLPDLLAAAGESPRRPCWRHADTVARLDDAAPPGTATWAQVCAPAVAVAALWDGARR